MERRHQPGPVLRECRQWQPTAWQTSSLDVPAVTTPTPPHRSSKFLPTAIRWNVGTFARMIGRVFAFLHENPLTDSHLRTQQTSRRHTRNYARAYHLRLNNVSPLGVARIMCHVGTKSARPFVAPSSEPQLGLSLTEPPRPYFHGSTIRSRRDGKKLSIPSISRTPAERRGAPSPNLKNRPLPAL